jgi:hypothetical protein
VTPLTVSSTEITFSYIFATCGTYEFVVTDETGACDANPASPFTLTLLADPCPRNDTFLTLGALRRDTQHRLGDDQGTIWSDAEVAGNLVDGYLQIATQHPVFWDVTYLESLPRGFSYTQPWEREFLRHSGAFDYGVANFTAEFERPAGRSIGFRERDRYGPANHTSPFEATDGFLARAGASTAMAATADLPKTLTKLDRVTWDLRVIDAVDPRTWSRLDGRYETNAGEVFAYTWQKDGVRTLRKIRVPAAQGDTVTVVGSWGLLRSYDSTVSSATPTGSWGIPRMLEGHHPIGPDLWGAPRRIYLDGKNMRVEQFRQGRVLDADEIVCELPQRYARYLVHFAMGACLSRPGPGYDEALAKFYDTLWTRGLARIERRTQLVDTERVVVMGGGGTSTTGRPPRPKLPANYGSVVR